MSGATLVQLEGCVWDAEATWSAAVSHLRQRFARVRPLPDGQADTVTPGELLHLQIRQLVDWAGDEIDWQRELTRWLDEHLPLYVRPERVVTQAIRSLATHGPVDMVSSLPLPAMESVLRHAGALRPVRELHPDASAVTFGDLAAGDVGLVVATDPAVDLPEGVRLVSSILQAEARRR